MQNLEPILIFVTVAEMGGFSHAADSLWHCQKGRASTAVRKLEEDVGVELLHRTTRSVQLTRRRTGISCVPASCLPTWTICTQCSQAMSRASRALTGYYA